MNDMLEEGTPQAALMGFMQAWRNADYDAMVKHTQLSWKASVPSVQSMLKAMFCFKPTLIRVNETRFLSDVSFEADMNICYEIARGVEKSLPVKAMVIRESAPLVPSPDGTWGVNPPSVHVI